MPLVALPALAADANYQTGITSVGPAMFIFTIAGALLLTLVFRSAANHAARFVTAQIGQVGTQFDSLAHPMIQVVGLEEKGWKSGNYFYNRNRLEDVVSVRILSDHPGGIHQCAVLQNLKVISN